METTHNQAVLFVFCATIALSIKGVFAKFAYLTGMGVDEVLLLRFGIAAPFFWLGVRFLARGSTPLTLAQWKVCLFPGTMFFVATYCDFNAVDLLGVGPSRLILFTFPVMVMLMNAVMLKQPPSLHQWIVFFITYAGISLVMLPDGFDSLEGLSLAGSFFALGAAFSYALYLISSQEIMKDLGSVRFTSASASITLALILLILPLSAGLDHLHFNTEGVLWGSALAIFCTVIPFFFLFEGIRRCGATQASLITLAGPVATIILAWIILDETLNSIQLGGALLSILGVASLKLGWLKSWVQNQIASRKRNPSLLD